MQFHKINLLFAIEIYWKCMKNFSINNFDTLQAVRFLKTNLGVYSIFSIFRCDIEYHLLDFYRQSIN